NGLACGTPPQDQILTHLGYFDHPGILAVPGASNNLLATKPAPVRLRVASETGYCLGLDTALRRPLWSFRQLRSSLGSW
ncbi:MAG: hypothetical protein ACK5WU_12860, partial [Alphaproteobacteria bacterium]